MCPLRYATIGTVRKVKASQAMQGEAKPSQAKPSQAKPSQAKPNNSNRVGPLTAFYHHRFRHNQWQEFKKRNIRQRFKGRLQRGFGLYQVGAVDTKEPRFNINAVAVVCKGIARHVGGPNT